eukprot:COSAG02_NODE_4014_length_5905_cov_3.990872_2_plen_52_part_00
MLQCTVSGTLGRERTDPLLGALSLLAILVGPLSRGSFVRCDRRDYVQLLAM